VFEVHTCRSCGSAYFKAFSFDPGAPDYLWAEDVGEVDDVEGVVEPVFLALEEPPVGSGARLDYLDPVSGASARGARRRERSGCRLSGRRTLQPVSSRVAHAAAHVAKTSWTT